MKTKTLYISPDIDMNNSAHLSYVHHTVSQLRLSHIPLENLYGNYPLTAKTDDDLTDSLFIYKEGFTLKYRIK